MAKQNTILQEFEKVRQSKALMTVGILLLIVLFGWTMTGIFMTQQKTVITTEQKNLATPLQPTIDTDIIDLLDTKRFYNAQELEGFTIYKQLSSDTGEKLIVPIELNLTDIKDQIDITEEDSNELETNNAEANTTVSNNTSANTVDKSN